MYAALLALALAAAPQESRVGERTEAQRRALGRLLYREVYSGIVRDGSLAMRMDPLPFTKRLPPGAPDIDVWQAAGYIRDLAVGDPTNDPVGRAAVDAGICTLNERPCEFLLVYLFSVQPSYLTSKPDLIGVRYVVLKHGVPWTEGVVWGCEGDPHHFVREGGSWREVVVREERRRMNAIVEFAHGIHKAELRVLEEEGLIIRR